MANMYSVDNGGVLLSASSTMTLIELTSGANIPAKIVEIGVSLDGATLTQGCKVQLGTRTSTSPTTSALTVANLQFGLGGSTATATKYTAEGTSPTYTPYLTWYVTNPGLLVIQYPLGREVYPAASTKWALMITTDASVTPNCAAHIIWEE